MTFRRVLSHVDTRVRDRAAAIRYYDRLCCALGMTGSYGDEWVVSRAEIDRVAALLPAFGSRAIEGRLLRVSAGTASGRK